MTSNYFGQGNRRNMRPGAPPTSASPGQANYRNRIDQIPDSFAGGFDEIGTIYSSICFAGGVQPPATLIFFQEARGQGVNGSNAPAAGGAGTNTPWDTNMQLPGQMAKDNAFK